MRNRIGAAIVIAGLFSTSAVAEEQIQWKQVLNIPKDANLAPGVTWEILGIAPGDSYETVRPRLDALLAEDVTPKSTVDKTTADLLGQDVSGPLEEVKLSIMLPVPGGQGIKATYVGTIELKRQLKGTGPKTIDDSLRLRFSTPASGSQVISLYRGITYYEHTDQVRIRDMIKSLTEKFGKGARVTRNQESTNLKYIFNDGKLFTPANIMEECYPSMGTGVGGLNEIDRINPTGHCDVVLEVTLGHGISDDHASSITFQIDDYGRAKENITADRGFMDAYVEEVRNRTAGQAPKL
jgi:hypothetical protein